MVQKAIDTLTMRPEFALALILAIVAAVGFSFTNRNLAVKNCVAIEEAEEEVREGQDKIEAHLLRIDNKNDSQEEKITTIQINQEKLATQYAEILRRLDRIDYKIDQWEPVEE